MNSQQWSRIETLFADAIGIPPAERQAWLLAACGDDEEIRAEVTRFLDQDEKAAGDRFLTVLSRSGLDPDRTGSWKSHSGNSAPPRPKQSVVQQAISSPTSPASPPGRRSPRVVIRTRYPTTNRWCGAAA